MLSTSDQTPRHTPGPWRVNGCELIGDSTILATLCWHTGRDAENRADSALIEAAPDMLSLLEWLNQRGGLGYDAHDRIGRVLARAKGKEQS